MPRNEASNMLFEQFPSQVNKSIPQNQHNVNNKTPSKSTGLKNTVANNDMQKAKNNTNIQDLFYYYLK